MHSAIAAAIVSAAVAIATGAPALAASAVPCRTPIRFLTLGDALLDGDPTPEPEAITVLGTGKSATVTINSGCGIPDRARIKANKKKGTIVTAKWKSCMGTAGDLRKVKLKAIIDPVSCGVMEGTLKAKRAKGTTTAKGKIKRVFLAVVSACGDGVRDAGNGEQCDPPGTPTCDPACQVAQVTPTTSTSSSSSSSSSSTSSSSTSSSGVPTSSTSSSTSPTVSTTTLPPSCHADPSRTIFAGSPFSRACRQFDGDGAACGAAWALAFGNLPVSCYFDHADECRGCAPTNEDAGNCVNACVAGPAAAASTAGRP